MSSSYLDRTIFNPELHAQIREFSFEDLPENATAAPPAVIKKWFGHHSSQE
jgi:hypothetical protein|tara:strand:- start:1173 stop:1325 length:153 start_codon:yes stop_codon:yes gene_type:complete